MRLTILLPLSLCFCLLSSAQRVKRVDSFWGLHFDHHSSIGDEELGKTLTEGMIDSMLVMARPDYIQVDSKGHPGISSYPTKVGQQAKSYTQDPLKLIRKVTAKRNVSLYVHHSGVRDINYVRLHPEQGRYKPDGTPDGENTSLWGDYADRLLIPQLKEFALDYGVDGAWVDGECWAVQPDYHPAAVAEFKKLYKVDSMPKKKGDPFYDEFIEFNRKKFISYLKYYTAEVKKAAPEFQLCSNWAFSAMMPEPIPSDMSLDFFSGDYDPSNALNAATWHGRCLKSQGRPFDLMAWSFVLPFATKTALQLTQEVSEVISLGGGCQIYFRQNADMSLQPASFPIMKEVADFVLARKPYCKGVEIVPQVGLFYSVGSWKKSMKSVYSSGGVNEIRGVLNALLDGQHSVEVVMSHQLKQSVAKYPVMVVPDWKEMEPEAVALLKNYVSEGGNLVLLGANSTRQFQELLGTDTLAMNTSGSLELNGLFITLQTPYNQPKENGTAKTLATLYEVNDKRFPQGVASTVTGCGKGKIAALYTNVGDTYFQTSSPVIRDQISLLVDQVFACPLVRVKGTHRIHVVPTRKQGKLLIQLVNTSGDHANLSVRGIDEIPVLRNISLAVHTDKRPASVRLQPENKALDYTFNNGQLELVVPEIPVHSVVEIVEK